MGFIGSLRRLVRLSEDAEKGIVDAAKASASIIEEAKSLQLSNLTEMFGTQYLKNINNVATLGLTELDSFVRFSRLGDYNNSFRAAFRDTDLLSTAGVRNTVNRVLRQAETELPDLAILKNDEALARNKKFFNITKDAKTTDDLNALVKNNKDLSESVNQLVKDTKRTGYLKLFGYSIAVAGAAVTAGFIYQLCVDEAQKSTGCFLYTQSGNKTVRCKVSQFSCLYPSNGTVCPNSSLPDDITKDTTACAGDNSKQYCLQTKCNAKLYATLNDNQTMRCEQKSASDVLLDGLNQIGAGAGSFVKNLLKQVIIWVLIALAIIVLFSVGSRLLFR